MSKRISATDRCLGARRGESGEAILTFALLLPVLLALSVAILEFSLLMMDYTRASEATRRAARVAGMEDAVGDLSNLATGDVVCSSTSGTTYCNGGTLLSAEAFTTIVQSMQAVLPDVSPENVQVVYSDSGVGTVESGGIKPLVSVNLVNLQRPFMFLHVVTGVPEQFTFPTFSTTQVLGGFVPP